jgi:DNA-binding NarL/FixJ family response regulator
MAEKITVLLVDDHILVRRGFRRVLEDESSIKVVGEAGDGAEAVRMARDLNPRVVLMDYAMPGMNGVIATRQIVSSCSKTAVLMLSMHTEDIRVRQALEAGARGYICKNAQDMDLVSAIRRVVLGEIVFDPQFSQDSARKGRRDNVLTPREREILQLIADGKSNKEIAALLNLSANTISAHRSNIMKALGTHKTAELVSYAISHGLISIT